MARTLDEIRDEAMQLSIEERAHLADELFDSLRTAEEREIEREWIEVAERRLEEVEAGTAVSYPLDEVMARLRAKDPGNPQE